MRRKPQTHPLLPVPNAKKKPIPTPENHPLWQFFRPDKQTMTSPAEDAKHGRSWTAQELRRKSFDDLHALWIICLKERNIMATQRHERKRQQLPKAGAKEASNRDWTVRRTMAGIKFVLNERFIGWTEAVELAKAEGLIEAPPQEQLETPAIQEKAYDAVLQDSVTPAREERVSA
ncbi:mitochondrial 39-S ribosomal protein L47 (MRP-L47)-domain-containing protein [Protomyces lactucae-debilis]|uniref:Large ribosomal subunit protein uL29m n=1 Tax=Protomyces lactucae-debilis TaxID=2754530 RepID=A0A1Y2FQ84_PROLT|nr:mitochondrial 39-S ribosomal protein L47 (MRP-L47)-domain-containing protein [Protomyces lactucae-debilis]ORY84865.1 mitochondrial 39-S ribosomal protein L47 (MRP-L47)-domain-containing protein [Protomyces lactucae-debilis]